MSISDLNSFENVIGLEVKVTNTFDTEFSGTIYSYIAQPAALVLQLPSVSGSSSYNYKFFRASHVKRLEITSQTIDKSKVIEIEPIHTETLSKIIKNNQDSVSLYIKTRNENVSRDAQLLFNAIHKTIPEVRWEKNSIIVLDEIKISPPYNAKSIKSLKQEDDENDEDNYIINMIKKIMDTVWVKIESQNKGG